MGRIAIAVAAALAWQGTAQARADGEPVIVVIGRGQAERPADFYVVEGEIRGEGPDTVAAMAALKARQERVFEGMTAMAGAERIGLETGKLAMSAAYPPDCEHSSRLRQSGPCQPSGYTATLPVTMIVRPAALVGRAGSLASELGMDNVEAGGGGLDDDDGLRAQANRAAFADARRQAETLAQAASARLGPLVRLQDSRATYASDGLINESSEIIVTGSRVMPRVDLTLRPEPVSASATVTAVFRLEP